MIRNGRENPRVLACRAPRIFTFKHPDIGASTATARRPVHERQALPFLLVYGSVPRCKIDRVIAVPRRTYAALYMYKELVYLAGNGTGEGTVEGEGDVPSVPAVHFENIAREL